MNVRRAVRLIPLVVVAVLAPLTPQAAQAAPVVPACLSPDSSSRAVYEDASGRASSAISTVFTPSTASCPQATYTFVVKSEDGSRLGWQPVGATPAGQVSADGSTVTVTFRGAGAAESFVISGNVPKSYDGRVGCVLLTVTASDATGAVSATYPSPTGDNPTGRLCKGPPAGSYYG